jgi:hypothetical protein
MVIQPISAWTIAALSAIWTIVVDSSRKRSAKNLDN